MCGTELAYHPMRYAELNYRIVLRDVRTSRSVWRYQGEHRRHGPAAQHGPPARAHRPGSSLHQISTTAPDQYHTRVAYGAA
eukprot:617743-Rhodomonas_salina.3